MTPSDTPQAGGDRARRAGVVAPDTPIVFEVVLRYPPREQQRIADEKAKLLAGATRSSRPGEAAERSADPNDVRAVQSFADRSGFTVLETHPDTRRMVLSGPANRVGKAFGVTFVEYEAPQGRYRDWEGHLTIPPDISDIVEAVLNLSTKPIARRSTDITP